MTPRVVRRAGVRFCTATAGGRRPISRGRYRKASSVPSPTRRIPDAQRERIRQKHEAELAALAAHAAAADRLAATEARRAEVLAEQDHLVEMARAEQADATLTLASLVGLEAAALLTGTAVTEVRRTAREATK